MWVQGSLYVFVWRIDCEVSFNQRWIESKVVLLWSGPSGRQGPWPRSGDPREARMTPLVGPLGPYLEHCKG